MTYSELQAAFEAYTGVSGEVDDSELAIWFNDAQMDLALDFGRVRHAELAPDEYGLAAPPPDNLKILDAATAYAWDSSGYMRFATTEPVTVTYRALPEAAHMLTGADQDQTPDLPYALHRLLAFYAAAMYWYRESEGDGEEMALAREWRAKYELEKRNYLNKMDRAGASDVDRWTVV